MEGGRWKGKGEGGNGEKATVEEHQKTEESWVEMKCCTHVPHFCIQGPLELQHVRILLWVDVVVREDDRQTIHRQSGKKDQDSGAQGCGIGGSPTS